MDRIRIGILGCADIAVSRVVPNLKMSRSVRIEAIASRNERRAREWAYKLEIPNSYGSYTDLLDDRSIDAVYIPLPNSLHAEWSVRSLEMGKHVLCEKPLALNVKEAERMIETADRCGLVLMEGFMYRYHSRNQRVFDMVQRGDIGRLRSVESSFTYVLGDDKSYLWNNTLGGGGLYDVGCYCINVSRMLTGGEPLDACGFADFTKGGVDLSFSGLMRFDHGVLSMFHVGMAEIDRFEYRVAGDRGLIEVPWAFVSFGKETHIQFRSGSDEKMISFAPEDEYVKEFDHFADLVAGRERPLYPIVDSIGNIAVLESLLRSARVAG